MILRILIENLDPGGKQIAKYKKYVYWLDDVGFGSLSSSLAKEGTPMYKSTKAICVPLSKGVEVGYVPPDAWEKYQLCKRQLSWYKTSRHFGRILVVSSLGLDDYGFSPETIIRESKFRLRRLPGKEEQLALIKQESYQRSKPAEWENIEDEDEELHDRWLKIMGVRGITYKELFVTHCANHANFIEPAHFIEEKNRPVPYSIAKTTHVCSACLELFNIIGPQFGKKFVVPCPGAVLFAGMAPSRYYEVVQPE